MGWSQMVIGYNVLGDHDWLDKADCYKREKDQKKKTKTKQQI